LEQLVEFLARLIYLSGKLSDFIANKWEMGFKNEIDRPEIIPLYQIKKRFLKEEKGHGCGPKREIGRLEKFG